MNQIPSQRFLITGGAGFIGSHLAESLLHAGHHVVALDNLSTGSVQNLAACLGSPHFRFVEGNILQEATLAPLVAEADVVVHLAAALGVQRILRKPVETLEVNVLGTHSVLRVARDHSRARVLVASTSEVYGKGFRTPFREDDDILLGPTAKSRWGYATSKMLDEFFALAYHEEYGTDVVLFRLFNTVGPRQASEYGMVMPRLIQQALREETITIYGDGQQTRCFCHVDDVVRALMGLALHPQATGKVFNIGSSEEVSIAALADQIIALTESSSPRTFIPYTEAYPAGFEDMLRRVPDTSRIRALLGWEPQLNLEQTIRSVIAFERSVLAGFEHRAAVS
jgi:UDP-glucose 4-epimerase